MGLAESMASVKIVKAEPKAEGKHYIPFSKKEWDAMEVHVGELEPKDLKRMLTMVFTGQAEFIVKTDLDVYIKSLEELLGKAKAAKAEADKAAAAKK